MKSDQQVETMPGQQASKQPENSKRKPVLSPELNEFLHVLKALETEFSSQPASAR